MKEYQELSIIYGVINITENQFDFMLVRSIMEMIFLISQLMERDRE
jgi:hypothetical protein